MHAVIRDNGTILWSDDPDLVSSVRTGPGHYILKFRRPCDRDVFVLQGKTAGPGCDAPRAIATSIQGGPFTICVAVSPSFDLAAGIDAQFSYIRLSQCLRNPSEEGEPIGCSVFESGDWSAWLNKMPPGPARLFVEGVVVVGNPGIEATLVRKSPQGFNPKILLLEVLTRQLPGIWPQVLTPKPVRFDEEASIDYTDVEVFCDQNHLAQIPVQIVE